MKRLIRFALGFCLIGFAVLPANAAFSSLQVFGDGVCTTTNNPIAGYLPYYGQRRSNGRVWVEVLAQQQGLTNNYWYSTNASERTAYTNLSAASTNWSYSSNNWSYYGQYSPNLLSNLSRFSAPADAGNALFVVWVNDADFVGDMGAIYPVYGTNITRWTNAINESLTNHFRAITNLYAKGVRTLILPNAVDITRIPQYDSSPAADKNFIRQRIIDFNAAFTAMLQQLAASPNYAGLTIYEPDVFTLLDSVLARPAAYGLTNDVYNGHNYDAIEDDRLTDKSLNGPGANYVFWDATDPTAKFHAVLADLVQQLIAPAQISKITPLNGSNRLDLINLPIGLNGFVDGATNLGDWTTVASIASTNATQTMMVPASGPSQFYRLHFPWGWTWP